MSRSCVLEPGHMGPCRLAEDPPDTETLRDRFAMAALTGLVTVPGMLPDVHARGAYQVADAMLAARKAKP